MEHAVFINVACGSGDAHTLAVSSDGKVWSWGDGDYGKLGRGYLLINISLIVTFVEKLKISHFLKVITLSMLFCYLFQRLSEFSNCYN